AAGLAVLDGSTMACAGAIGVLAPFTSTRAVSSPRAQSRFSAVSLSGVAMAVPSGPESRRFFFSSRRRHTRSKRDWSSDVCSSDLQDGINGTDGKSFDYDSLSPEQKLEIKGDKGDKGDSFHYEDFTQGQLDELRGKDGNDGKSTYELAVQEGFLGTLEEYLESLHGQDGQDGKPMTWEDLTITQREMLTGKDG